MGLLALPGAAVRLSLGFVAVAAVALVTGVAVSNDDPLRSGGPLVGHMFGSIEPTAHAFVARHQSVLVGVILVAWYLCRYLYREYYDRREAAVKTGELARGQD